MNDELIAELVAAPRSMRWRKPHTMPDDGTVVICAYRWSTGGELFVTLGRWFREGQYPGVIEAPDGAYIPCVGWIPLPVGNLHEEHTPYHLRAVFNDDAAKAKQGAQ